MLDDVKGNLPAEVLKSAHPATMLAYKEQQLDEAAMASAARRGLDPVLIKA